MTTSAQAPARTDWEAVIGLEVHAQLLTQSKMFCTCRAGYQDQPPNTGACPVCMGMPGVLPVINRQAIAHTVMTGLALNCSIAQDTHFDRKNYPYPDLMKGYQITQWDNPIASLGWLDVEVDDTTRRIGITRVHLEEDTARLQHVVDAAQDRYSLMDVNRAGVPLMEIVGEPDIRSAEEARQYLIKLRAILQYLGVSSADMEKGSFRCDANISIRPRGADELRAKVEVKNMNSLRAVFGALVFEFDRQVRVTEEGGRVPQETRGWVEERGVTVSQRSKEHAHDYRYFPEPDLPPLHIGSEWIDEIRAQIPELPDLRRDRYVADYALSTYDAALLTTSRATADYFEACLAAKFPQDAILSPSKDEPATKEPPLPLGEGGGEGEPLSRRAKAISNWLTGEMARLLNQSGADIADARVTPQTLSELIDLVEDGAITSTQARALFEEIFASGASPRQIVDQRGLAQVKDADTLLPAVRDAIDANPRAVADYLGGKETAIRFLTGQVMKATKGQANPTVVADLLQAQLESARGS
jgi:aspartyl-tRNA(Asn)/glutamyl-tRNA(Gln) amidotransferase subunit B